MIRFKKLSHKISWVTLVLFLAMTLLTGLPAQLAYAASVDGVTISTTEDVSALNVGDEFIVNISLQNASVAGLDFGIEWDTSTLEVKYDEIEEAHVYGPKSPLNTWYQSSPPDNEQDWAGGRIQYAGSTASEAAITNNKVIYSITFVVKAQGASYIRLFAPSSHNDTPDSVGFIYQDDDAQKTLYAVTNITNNLQSFTIGTPADTTVDISAISGVTAPARGATPVTAITETAQYTGTVSWSPNDSTFAASTVYTATITLTPKAGYTLTGVPANFFTVAGATSVTNAADSGVITAVFPATEEEPAFTISSASLDWDNRRIELTFSEGVYSSSDGTGGLALDGSDFNVVFNQNGGSMTGAGITQVFCPGNVLPVGGETTFWLYLSSDNPPPSGVETIEIKPAENSIFNSAGTAMSTDETSGVLQFPDKLVQFKDGHPAKYDIARDPGSKMVDFVVAAKNEIVTAKYVVVANGATPAPNKEQVGNGQDGNNLPAISSGTRADVPTTGAIISLTLQADNTTYDIYVIIIDDQGNVSDPAKVSLTTPPAVAADSTLSGLFIAGFDLDPAFSPSVTDYDVSVPYNVGSVQVSPTTANTNAVITVNGDTVASDDSSDFIDLPNYGETNPNVITVVVTAEDDSSTTYTINVYRAEPPAVTINSATMDTQNYYIDITFSEPVYGDASASSGINKEDFAVTFTQNGGEVSGASIRGVNNSSNVPPVGGETEFILLLDLVDGPPTGDETIAISPKADSVFSGYGRAAEATVTTVPMNLNVLPQQTFADGYPKAGEVQPDGSKKVEVLAMVNSDGVLFMVALPDNDETEPTAQQIKTHANIDGNPVLNWGGYSVTANIEQPLLIDNLDDDTNYDIWLVAEAGNNNFSSVEKVDVKTPPAIVVAPPGTIKNFACTAIDDNTATFKWAQATGATNLTIQFSLDNQNSWNDAAHSPIAANATTAVVTGLTESTAYIFRLVVTDGDNAGNSNLVYASTSPWGTISGTVKDVDGNPIAGANIMLYMAGGGGQNLIGSTNSAADGSYTISNVPVGTGRYASATKLHYIPENVLNIAVSEDTATTVNFVMEKILADGYPKVGPEQPDGSKKVSILIKANEPPTYAYFVVLPDEAAQPSEQQIKDGQDSTGAAAIYAYADDDGSPLPDDTEKEFVTDELPADDTAYDVYVVLKRGAYWSEIVKLDVTTPPAVTLTTVDIAEITGVTAPVRGATPVTSINETDQYTGAVSWSPEITDNKFAAETVYTATITLAPKADYTLTGVPADFFAVAGASSVSNAANSGVITAVFPETEAEPPVPVQSITVSGAGGATTMADRVAGGELQMIADVLPANATNKEVTWSVAPKGPAWSEVDPGQIGAGFAEIRADGLLYRGHTVGPVTVKATAKDGSGIYGETDITIVGVHMSTGGVNMIVESTYQLTAQAVPADTTEFTWASSNEEVATVSSTGLVTAVSPGTAAITATTANGRVGSCSIGVQPKPPATMADLTISEGTLTPAFDPNIYEYTATVANSIKSVTISATKWGDMDVSGDIGTFDLSVGKNTFEIYVDGGAGHEDSTYTVVITRKSASGGGSSGALPGFAIPTEGTTQEKYGFEADIPRGAVSSDTRGDIERFNSDKIDVPDDSFIPGYIYELTKKSSGDFLKPITVTLPYKQSAVDFEKYDLSIYWYDEDADEWVELDDVKVDEDDLTVSGETKKTGYFALIAAKKAVPPVEPPVEPELPVLTDISGHWAKANIEYLVQMGAISGYPDNTFKPDNPITRAEFAVVLVKAFDLEAATGKVFDDTASHWAKDYIATAAANGIVTGYSETEFGPDDLITREQMAVMIVKAAKMSLLNGELNFSDAEDISDWATSYVVTAVQNELMKGYLDNSFKPLGNATRAEAVTVIYNALK